MTVGNITLEAATALGRDWGYDTLTDLGPVLTCKEVEALSLLLEAVGQFDKSQALMNSHSDGDDESDDWHYRNATPMYARPFEEVFSA